MTSASACGCSAGVRASARVCRALLLLGLLLPGCVRRLPPSAFARDEVTVACCGHADEPVELRFLGVAGWLIRKGDAAVLTAPLFSNPGLLRAGLQEIHPDPDRIERHLPDVSDVTAILVGHGHYDHLMDVPYIALQRAPRAVVFGNRTVGHQLAPFGLRPPDRVRVIESGELADVKKPAEWIRAGEGVRILPLRSDHAPHFAGIVLYSGDRGRDMDTVPLAANEWLEGESVAYLIDLLNDDGSVGLRIYFQDAVAAAPFGLVPPPEVLGDSVRVDVAIIVPATYAEVDWHPEALLESALPRHVLLCHWEDFFEPPSRLPEPVPFTRLPEFLDRLGRALPEGTGWHVPLPGTRFLFH